MHSWHAKSRCCRAKIYHFGSRRRQCSQCKRTWRIRKKQRGRKPRRARPGTLKAVLLDGRTLKTLAPRYGLTHQGLVVRKNPRRFFLTSDIAMMYDSHHGIPYQSPGHRASQPDSAILFDLPGPLGASLGVGKG